MATPRTERRLGASTKFRRNCCSSPYIIMAMILFFCLHNKLTCDETEDKFRFPNVICRLYESFPFRTKRTTFEISNTTDSVVESSLVTSNAHNVTEKLSSQISDKLPVRKRVLAVVGIQTGFQNKNRRNALRQTWLPASPTKMKQLADCTGLMFHFILGTTDNTWLELEVKNEMETYNDIIRVDILEKYSNLNQKVLIYFKMIYKMYDADFYVKADDDIYLRPDRLSTLLSKPRTSPLTYLGCMKKGGVITDSRLKWFEPKSYILGKEYFLHAYGPIYALSNQITSILSSLPLGSLRMFMNEDVSIGAWMIAFNVTHEQIFPLCQKSCSPQAIAVWDIPTCSGLCDAPHKLPELHKLQECSKDGATLKCFENIQ